ncbi:hypothetical protein AAHA92_30907 [Salvia divinorum]|uniref:Uncharacterized protein n=1 Tax=Salvia divinorum TaxID=28513 RepID=A0ABD1FSG9_SALDI
MLLQTTTIASTASYLRRCPSRRHLTTPARSDSASPSSPCCRSMLLKIRAETSLKNKPANYWTKLSPPTLLELSRVIKTMESKTN